ncbi:uncharacterized protein [Anser cygnoides]|uniref:uncharacterized protein n=1 Tax=Anser cygnoides TaxID=8845 RepID=UPI0034D19ECB
MGREAEHSAANPALLQSSPHMISSRDLSSSISEQSGLFALRSTLSSQDSCQAAAVEPHKAHHVSGGSGALWERGLERSTRYSGAWRKISSVAVPSTCRASAPAPRCGPLPPGPCSYQPAQQRRTSRNKSPDTGCQRPYSTSLPELSTNSNLPMVHTPASAVSGCSPLTPTGMIPVSVGTSLE